jgi:hypothetical protein
VTAKVPIGDTGLFGDRPNRALVVSMPVSWPLKAASQPSGSKPEGANVELAAAVEIYLSAPDNVLEVIKKGDDLHGRITLTRGEIIPTKRSVAGHDVIYAGTIRFLGDFQPDIMPRPLAVNPPSTVLPVPVPDPMQPIVRSVSKIKKVVFVCDASGSMLQKFDGLKRELSKSIHQLQPDQSFNLIFFQEQSCKPLDQNLLIAHPDEMRRADRFLETIVPRGETEPLLALEQAFKQKPDLIYLLTDGDFPNNKAVLKRIQELEKGRIVKINTIAFVNETDKDTDFMALLQKIAKDTGGAYKYVRENSL